MAKYTTLLGPPKNNFYNVEWTSGLSAVRVPWASTAPVRMTVTHQDPHDTGNGGIAFRFVGDLSHSFGPLDSKDYASAAPYLITFVVAGNTYYVDINIDTRRSFRTTVEVQTIGSYSYIDIRVVGPSTLRFDYLLRDLMAMRPTDTMTLTVEDWNPKVYVYNSYAYRNVRGIYAAYLGSNKLDAIYLGDNKIL